jgi:hypothetical protein
MGNDHNVHVSIIHGHGHVLFEGSRETREAGGIIPRHRHEIEAMRSLTRVASCAERPHPGIEMITAHGGDG